MCLISGHLELGSFVTAQCYLYVFLDHNSLELLGTKEFTELQSLNSSLLMYFGHVWSQTGHGWHMSDF